MASLKKQAKRPGRAGFHARTSIVQGLITKSKEADRASREKVATIGARSRVAQSLIRGQSSLNTQKEENAGDMAIRELMEKGAGARQTSTNKAAMGRITESGRQKRLSQSQLYDEEFGHVKRLDEYEANKRKKKGGYVFEGKKKKSGELLDVTNLLQLN